MNLLDIFEGREPHQQAIDRLEQARIAHLEEKMDYYAKHGMAAEFKKAKAERDSYLKVQDECMGYGTLVGEGQMKQMMHKDAERMSREAFCEKYGNEEWVGEFWDNVSGPLDEAGIGQDIVNKTEKMARATPPTKAGAVASTVKNAAKWLAGKGGPGKEGPTYESAQKKNSEEVDEAYGPYGVKSASDIKRIERAKEREKKDVGMYRKQKPSVKKKYIDQNIAFARTVDEGWSDAIVAQRTGRPRTPYSVYIKGKKWKDFENDDHAEAVANKLRAKFRAEGRDPSVITIAPTDYDKGIEEEQKPLGFGEFPPKQEITIIPPKKLKSGETYQDRNKYWQSQGQAPIYKTNEAEGQTDYSKRRQRERDVDAGKPVAKQRQPRMTDYQKRRAQQKKDMELGEDYSNETRDAVESAIIRRIMVAHTDLLKKFGPQKVMDAAQAVADEHSDVEEIGTSDVSAFVQQVERYLAMNY